MTVEKLYNYFKDQQVSPQWAPILRCMATELTAQLSEQELHNLFFKIGHRLALEMGADFEGLQTLSGLEEKVNDLWALMNWGWVEIKEAGDGMDVRHQCAPLAEGFGDDAMRWSVGLLEGFYQTLFYSLGASDSLRVRIVGEPLAGMETYLRFGHHIP